MPVCLLSGNSDGEDLLGLPSRGSGISRFLLGRDGEAVDGRWTCAEVSVQLANENLSMCRIINCWVNLCAGKTEIVGRDEMDCESVPVLTAVTRLPADVRREKQIKQPASPSFPPHSKFENACSILTGL